MDKQTMRRGETAVNIDDDEIEITLRVRRSQLALVAAAFGGAVPTPTYVFERTPELRALGVTDRSFCDACRADEIKDAVRTPSGWRATVDAVNAWLAERRKPRTKKPAPLRVVEPPPVERDPLAQVGAPRRAR